MVDCQLCQHRPTATNVEDGKIRKKLSVRTIGNRNTYSGSLARRTPRQRTASVLRCSPDAGMENCPASARRTAIATGTAK